MIDAKTLMFMKTNLLYIIPCINNTCRIPLINFKNIKLVIKYKNKYNELEYYETLIHDKDDYTNYDKSLTIYNKDTYNSNRCIQNKINYYFEATGKDGKIIRYDYESLVKGCLKDLVNFQVITGRPINKDNNGDPLFLIVIDVDMKYVKDDNGKYVLYRDGIASLKNFIASINKRIQSNLTYERFTNTFTVQTKGNGFQYWFYTAIHWLASESIITFPGYDGIEILSGGHLATMPHSIELQPIRDSTDIPELRYSDKIKKYKPYGCCKDYIVVNDTKIKAIPTELVTYMGANDMIQNIIIKQVNKNNENIYDLEYPVNAFYNNEEYLEFIKDIDNDTHKYKYLVELFKCVYKVDSGYINNYNKFVKCIYIIISETDNKDDALFVSIYVMQTLYVLFCSNQEKHIDEISSLVNSYKTIKNPITIASALDIIKQKGSHVRHMTYKDYYDKYKLCFKDTRNNKDCRSISKKNKDSKIEYKDQIIDRICDTISSLDKNIIYKDNGISFPNIRKLHRKHIDADDIALLFRQTFICVEQCGTLYFIIKEYDLYKNDKKEEYCITINLHKNNISKYDKSLKVMIRLDEDEVYIEFNIKKLILDVANSMLYDNIVFYPYSVKTGDKTPSNYFNMFTGFLHNYESNFKVDMNIVNSFLNAYNEILCDNNVDRYNFEINKIAHILQKPYIKTEALSIMYGGQGIGKSFLLRFLVDFVFGKALTTTIYSSELLTSNFNVHLMGKLFILLEEGVDLTKTTDIAKFKGMIRNKTIKIARKGIDVDDDINCYMNFFIATNTNYNAMFKEADERVVLYNTCSNKYKCNTKYFENLSEVLHNLNAGKHVFHYLMNLDLSNFNIRKVIQSNEKLEKKINSSSSFIKYLYITYKNDFDEDNEMYSLLSELCIDENGESYYKYCEDKVFNVKITTIMNSYIKVCENVLNCRNTICKKEVKALLENMEFKIQKYRSVGDRYDYCFSKNNIKLALCKYFDIDNIV